MVWTQILHQPNPWQDPRLSQSLVRWIPCEAQESTRLSRALCAYPGRNHRIVDCFLPAWIRTSDGRQPLTVVPSSTLLNSAHTPLGSLATSQVGKAVAGNKLPWFLSGMQTSYKDWAAVPSPRPKSVSVPFGLPCSGTEVLQWPDDIDRMLFAASAHQVLLDKSWRCRQVTDLCLISVKSQRSV